MHHVTNPYELKRPDLKGNFVCVTCNKVFCHSSSLSRHRIVTHYKGYQCMLCNESILPGQSSENSKFIEPSVVTPFMFPLTINPPDASTPIITDPLSAESRTSPQTKSKTLPTSYPMMNNVYPFMVNTPLNYFTYFTPQAQNLGVPPAMSPSNMIPQNVIIAPFIPGFGSLMPPYNPIDFSNFIRTPFCLNPKPTKKEVNVENQYEPLASSSTSMTSLNFNSTLNSTINDSDRKYKRKCKNSPQKSAGNGVTVLNTSEFPSLFVTDGETAKHQQSESNRNSPSSTVSNRVDSEISEIQNTIREVKEQLKRIVRQQNYHSVV